jgi:transcriptional antiterminator NusG
MNSESRTNVSVEKDDAKKNIEGLNWYSLRVMSGKEKLVEQNIYYEAKINNIENMIDEVFVPFEKVVELKNNKKTVKEKMFFPGYILIKMLLNKKSKYIIENINGVMSFVGPKGKSPVPLRDDEIKRIFGEVERKEGREVLVTPFKKGDFVKVIAGPFIDFSGTVDEVNDDKQKVKIVISIFGRMTSVELDYFQVEVEK